MDSSADSPGRPRQARAADTRARLVAAGRDLFGSHGYDSVSLDQVGARAEVTKGALYHHFPAGKRQLFEAVHTEVEAEITRRVAGALPLDRAAGPPQVLAAIRAAISRFLDLSLDSDLQQIALTDAPAVLGWRRWREIAAEQGLGLVELSLSAAIASGELSEQPVKPLAHMFMAALSEAAMLIAAATDKAAARAEVEGALMALLDGLTGDPGPAQSSR